MKKFIITLVFLFFGLNVNAAQLRFAQVTDVHYSKSGKIQQNSSRDVSRMGKALGWLVTSLNINKPQFVVFMGDNIDKSKEADIIDFLTIIKPLKMPYYITFGNHDAHKVSGVKKEDFWAIVKKYNKNNKSKLGYYYFSPNSDFLCIVLDGAVPFAPTAHGIYTDEQLMWLDKTLKKNKNKKVIIFQHFPLVEPTENPSHTMLYKEKYTAVIDKYDNIISISSGHFHTSKVTVDEKGIYHISSPALVSAHHPYDIVTVDYTKIPFKKMKINKIDIKTVNLQ